MKDTFTAILVLAACLVIGDKLWTIALAAGLILAAAIVSHGKKTST